MAITPAGRLVTRARSATILSFQLFWNFLAIWVGRQYKQEVRSSLNLHWAPRLSEQDTFADFLHRIPTGDQQAAVELVRRYESVICREVRLRLTDPALFRLVDSIDICQS